MFARIAMFGLALLALWMIWRVVRQWIDANAARPDDVHENREGRRLSHQRDDGSAPWIATVASSDGARSGVRRGDDSRDPDAARDVDSPRVGDDQPGSDTPGDSGSGGGGDSGGSGGGSD